MHGPEHWLGLLRAWLIVGLVVYGLWTLLDRIHSLAADAFRRVAGTD